MMRTGKTYRWRRSFFVALGFLFPVGFIASLMHLRGSMSLSLEHMLGGDAILVRVPIGATGTRR